MERAYCLRTVEENGFGCRLCLPAAYNSFQGGVWKHHVERYTAKLITGPVGALFVFSSGATSDFVSSGRRKIAMEAERVGNDLHWNTRGRKQDERVCRDMATRRRKTPTFLSIAQSTGPMLMGSFRAFSPRRVEKRLTIQRVARMSPELVDRPEIGATAPAGRAEQQRKKLREP